MASTPVLIRFIIQDQTASRDETRTGYDGIKRVAYDHITGLTGLLNSAISVEPFRAVFSLGVFVLLVL